MAVAAKRLKETTTTATAGDDALAAANAKIDAAKAAFIAAEDAFNQREAVRLEAAKNAAGVVLRQAIENQKIIITARLTNLMARPIVAKTESALDKTKAMLKARQNDIHRAIRGYMGNREQQAELARLDVLIVKVNENTAQFGLMKNAAAKGEKTAADLEGLAQDIYAGLTFSELVGV